MTVETGELHYELPPDLPLVSGEQLDKAAALQEEAKELGAQLLEYPDLADRLAKKWGYDAFRAAYMLGDPRDEARRHGLYIESEVPGFIEALATKGVLPEAPTAMDLWQAEETVVDIRGTIRAIAPADRESRVATARRRASELVIRHTPFVKGFDSKSTARMLGPQRLRLRV